jgi:hypothetical protein
MKTGRSKAGTGTSQRVLAYGKKLHITLNHEGRLPDSAHCIRETADDPFNITPGMAIVHEYDGVAVPFGGVERILEASDRSWVSDAEF